LIEPRKGAIALKPSLHAPTTAEMAEFMADDNRQSLTFRRWIACEAEWQYAAPSVVRFAPDNIHNLHTSIKITHRDRGAA
jgi:hypothetical protein